MNKHLLIKRIALISLLVIIGGLFLYNVKFTFTDFQREFQTSSLQLIANLEESVVIGIMTDIGYCSPHGFDSEKQLSSFLEDMVSRNVDFQVSLGDNAKIGSGDCSDTGDEDNKFIVEKLRSNGIPSYFALGDHDIASQVESYQAWLQNVGVEKTYQSFDVGDVHVVILDTVLGGDPMSPRCEELELCNRLSREAQRGSPEAVALYEAENQRVKDTRSKGIRDRGRLGDEQLRWLENDLQSTEKEKVVVFSDHPLFPFDSPRKSYHTANADKVRNIVKASKKEAVFISGEAHLWHEEVFEDQQFYIVDLLDRFNGSWAVFTWDNDGFHFEKVVR